jgi:hypothetical protein
VGIWCDPRREHCSVRAGKSDHCPRLTGGPATVGLYHRQEAGSSHVAGQWRKLSPSAELMVDPGCGTRCDPGHWGGVAKAASIGLTIFDETEPVAEGRRHALGILAYVDGGELSSGGRDNGSLARSLIVKRGQVSLAARLETDNGVQCPGVCPPALCNVGCPLARPPLSPMV